MKTRTDDVVIVGSGIGGLTCALSLKSRSVTLLTKTRQLQSGSSLLAQGGIAAAVGPDDSPQAHAADTISAGAGLSNVERTQQLTAEGAASLEWLIAEGIPFDRDLHGGLELAKEAAHRYARVAHAGGDATGKVLVGALDERVREVATINVIEDAFACDLVVHDGHVRGVVAFNPDEGWVFYSAPQVVLATGGIGMAWQNTTTPGEATGDGLAMAARAGARLADLEFVQFHPTALAVPSENGARLPLLTEALRGAGALLLDELGQRIMLSEHPLAELAPRDVVARAIERKTLSGEPVFLDLRPVLSRRQELAFPQAVATAKEAGFDPFEEPLPVTPAAHYHMGGIDVDDVGRTSIGGLWACGEVASTGIHGANRLASNSLLEALVYARKIAGHIRRNPAVVSGDTQTTPKAVPMPGGDLQADCREVLAEVRGIMTRNVGILRNGAELEVACIALSGIAEQLRQFEKRRLSESPTVDDARLWGETRNLILVARLVAIAALRREESRGAHFRDDYPAPKSEWCRQQRFTVSSLLEAH
jgi:L-aspartate oxidase